MPRDDDARLQARLPPLPEANAVSGVDSVLGALIRYGMLLKQDKELPSVVGIVAGESVRGSWWSHPRAHEIFAILSELTDHPDVLVTKLLHRKDTLVHRALWPHLLGVGNARADWQLEGLSDAALALLERLDASVEPVMASGAAARELQYRLLAVGSEVHTESGRHAMVLESWTAWAARAGCTATESEHDARECLESAARKLGAREKSLPWNS
jgi:hypothetical protein